MDLPPKGNCPVTIWVGKQCNPNSLAPFPQGSFCVFLGCSGPFRRVFAPSAAKKSSLMGSNRF
jgi:hypothetical protein